MRDKISLRKTLEEKRRKIPAFLRNKKSKRILLKLSRAPEFLKAEHVALYYGIAGEVETRPFFKKILYQKKVYLPRVKAQQKTLTFRRVTALSHFEKGSYGIMEPKAACPRRSAKLMDLIVVPGVGFDRSGNRLGRGGGYYDRVLSRAPKVPTIGLCFREQIVKKIPVNARDVRVGRVITD